MNRLMFDETLLAREGGTALGAAIGSRAIVELRVTLEMTASRESLAAAVAHVRTFARVRAHVTLERAWLCERFLADLAGERALGRVKTTVLLKILEDGERLVALAALVNTHWFPRQKKQNKITSR